MFSRILFLSIFFTASLQASMVDDLQDYISVYYLGFITTIQSIRWWIFSIAPVAAMVISISKNVSAIKEENQMMAQDNSLKGEDVGKIVFDTILVVSGFYILYGVFGLVYAGANSFAEVWGILVESFWGDLFS